LWFSETGNLDFGYKLVRLSTTDQEGISEFPMPHVVVFFVFNGLRREQMTIPLTSYRPINPQNHKKTQQFQYITVH
jgi:hypothetical protein